MQIALFGTKFSILFPQDCSIWASCEPLAPLHFPRMHLFFLISPIDCLYNEVQFLRLCSLQNFKRVTKQHRAVQFFLEGNDPYSSQNIPHSLGYPKVHHGIQKISQLLYIST